MTRYAHTLPDTEPSGWEPIEVHLQAVAGTAKRFAEELGKHKGGAALWGETLGRWHDVGKYSDAFQNYLLKSNDREEAHIEGSAGRVDHSTAGAQYAAQQCQPEGRLLAYIIAGHHAGLADAEKLGQRLKKTIEPWDAAPESVIGQTPTLWPPPIEFDSNSRKRVAFQFAFFTRMLFSCLVDADWLETEAFCDPEASKQRESSVELTALKPVLDASLAELAAGAEATEVNRHRQKILKACRKAASQPPGLFSLTVPTGGGKTLASLAFALDHAQQHDSRRVVMAIPFTSIIEQTAAKYRDVFKSLGSGVVIEHHSNLEVKPDDFGSKSPGAANPDADSHRDRLAAENWDAPLIVTTNVQLFESLFSSRTRSCRKLHRLAGSVIILDEAQTLPPDLLAPCLAALRELVANYGCTIVLCTATQPALDHRDEFPIGLEGVREIIPEPAQLYQAMRRVEVQQLGRMDDDALLEQLTDRPSWLTIVNTKAHAAELYRRLSNGADFENLFHLSTHMCAMHRSEKLNQIRQRLHDKKPCRVVSTQLIEAGVDVDFPVVFRAMAGIDSIAQAAGRCNREGQLPRPGQVLLFEPADVQPKGLLGQTADTTRELLPDYDDLLDPAAIRHYFELHYWQQEGNHRWDEKQVMKCFPEERGKFAYDFRAADEQFQLIENQTTTIFVPYGDGAKLIEQLQRQRQGYGPSRMLLRRLQRYSVGLTDWVCQPLVTSGDIEISDQGYGILVNASLLDDNLGLRVDAPGHHDPESLVL